MGKIDIETALIYICGICSFLFGIIGWLGSHLYRIQSRRNEERWKDHHEDRDKWRQDYNNRLEQEIDELTDSMREGIKEERQFRYNEMTETKQSIKELFESRKKICSNISDIKARCEERHK